MSLRAARAAPTLAANIGKGVNSTAIMGSLKGVEDARKAEDQYQRRLAYLYAAREKRLDYLKGQFPNIFHYMEVDDLAVPSCIAHLADGILRSISTNLGQHGVKTFHAVRMGGGAYMCMLPHEVDLFELKLGPEICRDWLEARPGHGYPVKQIKESWEAAKRLNLDPRETYGNLAFDIGKTRLVTSADKQCLITYFLES
jgi:hypothetical protein